MLRYLMFVATFCVGSLWSLTPQEIDHLAEQTLQEWGIPGLSIAILHKGEELHVKGYGVREMGSEKLVDSDTLFQINSLTKAFTSLTVNLLVNEGKIGWDVPIRSYLPDFQSKDPFVTEQLTVRDLLCHRSGLPGNLYGGWRLFGYAHRSMDQLVQSLAFVDLAFPYRARFNYDNLGYAVVGEIVAISSGMPWAEFCRQRIIAPLNMSRTTISYAAYLDDDNAALPHISGKEGPQSGYNWEKDSMEAASGIISNARDMALWLKFCLENTSDLGETLLPLTEITPDNFLSSIDLPKFPFVFYGQTPVHYGMGWWTYKIDGKDVYAHTGSSEGMQSVLTMIPEEQLGIVILSNHSRHLGISCLQNQLLDRLLEHPETDWHVLGHQAMDDVKSRKNKRLERYQAARKEEIPPSLDLHNYKGMYSHLAYGTITIGAGDCGLDLTMNLSNEKGVLDHWEGDKFQIIDLPSESNKPYLCEFILTDDGEIAGLKLPFLGVFEKVGTGKK